MKSYINEDDILLLLNDINIQDEDLSEDNFSNEEIENVQDKAIKSIVKGSRNKRKALLAASLVLIILIYPISQTTLAKTAMSAINSLMLYDDKAIENAVKNDYYEPLSTTSYSNGIEIKLTNMMADKTKIVLYFDIKLDDKELLKNINGFYLDTELSDENDKILNGGSASTIDDKKNLNVISLGVDEFKTISEEEGLARYTVMFSSNKGNIPKLNRLKIKVKTLMYSVKSKDDLNKLNGSWKFNVEVNDKFKDYNSSVFVAKNSDNGVKIESAETTPTGTLVRFSTDDYIGINILDKAVLIDDKGNEAKVTGVISMEDEEKRHVYTVNFPVTIFENPNAFKFLIKKSEGDNIEIKLEKK